VKSEAYLPLPLKLKYEVIDLDDLVLMWLVADVKLAKEVE
jgi:hypothetical protein